MKMQPAFFDRLAKEVQDLTGLNLSSFKDKKVRKELIIKSLPYVSAGYVGNKLSYVYGLSKAKDKLGKLMDMMDRLDGIFSFPLISLDMRDILAGIAVGAGLRLAVYLKGKDAKKFRKGKEYGSAELGTAKDIEPFIDHNDPDNNIILTQTEQLSLAGRMPSPLHNRNKNVLVIGGSGSGKTRFFAKPNLMQLNCSFVFTDPKGSCLEETGYLLKKAGYKIRVLNTIDFTKSMRYNPFSYIHKESDIMKVADALIEGTTTGKQQGEQFWLDAERLLYNALIGYIVYMAEDEEEKNFSTLLDMVNAMEIREEDDDFKNAVDFMFDELKELDPDNFAVRQYLKFKQAAGKTARSIMITVGARLSRFDIQAVRDVMLYDELSLDTIGEEKTALFIITSDTTKTFNFMANILYTQLFNLLCEKADLEYGGRLPVHVHCILDEFANLGKIPDFEILISTIRSREISASIILQSLAQLKSIYDKQADIIADNCDSLLFLGGKGKDTLKEISELLGKETIDLYNTSDTRGNSPSYGMNYQKVGRELFTPDELARLPGDKCILQIRGVKPFCSEKYDITKHKRYKYLADYNPKLKYDIRRELSVKLSVQSEEECEYTDLTDEQIVNELNDFQKKILKTGNKGIAKSRYFLITLNEPYYKVKSKVDEITARIQNEFLEKMGVTARVLDGYERLSVLFLMLNPYHGEKFIFNWDAAKNGGVSEKEQLTNHAFEFGKRSDRFMIGSRYGCVSYLKLTASQISDRMLCQFLDLDSEITVSFHFEPISQEKALKSVKTLVSNLQKMVIDEQKDAARQGYGMENISPQLRRDVEAAEKLMDDVSQNDEKMFMVTITMVQILR